jgi:hypothetical protein
MVLDQALYGLALEFIYIKFAISIINNKRKGNTLEFSKDYLVYVE